MNDLAGEKKLHSSVSHVTRRASVNTKKNSISSQLGSKADRTSNISEDTESSYGNILQKQMLETPQTIATVRLPLPYTESERDADADDFEELCLNGGLMSALGFDARDTVPPRPSHAVDISNGEQTEAGSSFRIFGEGVYNTSTHENEHFDDTSPSLRSSDSETYITFDTGNCNVPTEDERREFDLEASFYLPGLENLAVIDKVRPSSFEIEDYVDMRSVTA